MFCCAVFLWCFFMCPTESTQNKVFYITGYNTSNASEVNQTTTSYRYENNEVLNLSCHMKQTKKPVPMLRWLHNEQTIPGIKDNSKENKLQFNITKSNDKDRLACLAFEDDTGFPKDEKKIYKMIILILEYIDHKDTTTPALDPLDNKEKNTEESFFQKLLKNPLFWIIFAVAIVIIILTTVVVFATKMSYRIKEDKIGLQPAVSNTSVFTTASRAATLPLHKIPGENFYTNDTHTNKVGLNFAVSNAAYFNTESRKPTIVYTNDTYNITPLNTSREIIDSEYQEPIDSQAYCEPQMYSEPEKQFYAEPIPKKLRMKKDIVYENYNKNNGSPNIKHQNIDLYQNDCKDVNDEECCYYSETS